jgi:hypothetical protein
MSRKSQAPAKRFARMVKPPILPRDDSKTYEIGVSQEHEALIGAAIARWSYVEIVIQELIWRILGFNVDVGRKITARLDFSYKSRMLKEIAGTKFSGEELSLLLGFIGRLDDLYIVRNMIAHGQWVTIKPDDMPAVQMLREALPEGSGGEEVVITDMNREFMLSIIEHMVACLRLLGRYRNEIPAT